MNDHHLAPLAVDDRAVRSAALDCVGLSKSYGATQALREVSLNLQVGEVHALLGENGAGKSTLVKILSGIIRPDAGRIRIGGTPFEPDCLMEARAVGVSTAFQELSLVPNLTVAANIMLPRLVKGPFGFASPKVNESAAEAGLAEVDAADINPAAMAGDLSLAEKQRVEIVRALRHRPRVLVLDEPTAALVRPEWLFRQVERVAAAGTTVLYITHRLAEVRRLCSRATVLRNGLNVGTVAIADVTDEHLFRMMVGKTPTNGAFLAAKAPGERHAISVSGVSGDTINDINFELHAGEIVGVAALEGQGQRELFRALGGAVPIRRGAVLIDGDVVGLHSPSDAVAAGIGFLPEERKSEGIFSGLGTVANISLPILDQLTHLGLIDRDKEHLRVAEQAAKVELSQAYLALSVDALSGGNQQKALLARVLMSGARHLVLFDPTRGVDVGTKQVIYDVIRRFAADGGSVLVYSTDLEELVHLSHRCLVIYRGRIVGDVPEASLSEAGLVALASGQGTSNAAGATAEADSAFKDALMFLSKNGALVAAAIFVALFSLFASQQPGALTMLSLTNLFNNALPLALAAAGGTFVLLTRGFDLSVAGVVSLANVLVVTLLGDGAWAPLLGLAIVVAVGLTVGAINGFLVAYVGLQSITATLSTMLICSGIALLVLPTPGGSVPDSIAYDLTDLVFGVPVAAVIATAVAAVWLAFRHTDSGVAIYAVGADPTAAEYAGVPVRQTRALAYCLAGVLYGLAGYMLTALTASGDPNSGSFYLILVFSAIAIGGTAFTGGRGGLIGSMIGAATLTLLPMMLFSFGVMSFATSIVQGALMILAVIVGVHAAQLGSRGRT